LAGGHTNTNFIRNFIHVPFETLTVHFLLGHKNKFKILYGKLTTYIPFRTMAMADADETFEMARDLFDDWQLENRGWNPHSNRTLKEWMEKARGNFIMHWKESQKYSKLLYALAIPTLILSAWLGVQGIESAFLEEDLSTSERVVRGLSAVLTMVVGSLSNVLAFMDPKSKEAAFREASNEFSDISARLRFEYDRDWNHRTPHVLLMKSVMTQMSEIKKSTPALSEASINAYQASMHQTDTTYLPDIMVPIGKMGEDPDPNYSWIRGTQRQPPPRGRPSGTSGGRTKANSALLRLAASRKKPPTAIRRASSSQEGKRDDLSPKSAKSSTNGSVASHEPAILPPSPPASDTSRPVYDPHDDEEAGRSPDPQREDVDLTRDYEENKGDHLLFN